MKLTTKSCINEGRRKGDCLGTTHREIRDVPNYTQRTSNEKSVVVTKANPEASSMTPAMSAHTERHDLADYDSSEAARAMYRDRDGNEFRGDDALFQALLNGATAKIAGHLANLSERTVFRRLADPGFKQRLESAREMVRDSILSRLTDAAGHAVDTLWELLEEDEPSVRLGAAKSLLDALVKLQNAGPKQTTTVRYTVEKTNDG